MWGAIIGDIVGSVYEFNNIKTKDFPLFCKGLHFTDDTVMTAAIAHAIMTSRKNGTALNEAAIKSMQTLGRKYSNCGFGPSFNTWIHSTNPQPYNSWGNGSAMRVSPCAWAANSLDEAKQMSDAVTSVTHNHPGGLKGAAATAVAIFMARTGKGISQIKDYICDNYYPIDFELGDIRADYKFHVSCKYSVPQAMQAFFESISFEDAIRNAISIGGDSDTIATITGSIAGAYYGVPEHLIKTAKQIIPNDLNMIVTNFSNLYINNRIR